MKVGITTCCKYAFYTLPKILYDLAWCGISNEDVFVFGLSEKHQEYEQLSFMFEYLNKCMKDPIFIIPDTCRVINRNAFNEHLRKSEQKVVEGCDYVGLRSDIDMCHVGAYTHSFIQKAIGKVSGYYNNTSKKEKISLEISGWLKGMADNYGAVQINEDWTGKRSYLGAERWVRKWSCGLEKYTMHRSIEDVEG